MRASDLFHKKKKRTTRRRRRSSGGTGNLCCPVIRVKCSRKKYKAGPGRYGAAGGGTPTLAERLKNYKAAKAAFSKATGLGGTGPIHPNHEATSIAAVAKTVGHAKGSPAMRCTVSIGGHRSKGMTGAQAQAKVAAAIRAQKAKRCVPLVQRG